MKTHRSCCSRCGIRKQRSLVCIAGKTIGLSFELRTNLSSSAKCESRDCRRSAQSWCLRLAFTRLPGKAGAGENVLILGATGVAGKLAVKVAKPLGPIE
jgi:hypothetical protein